MAAVDDASSVLLLRAIRSGAADVDCSFVHRTDVCSAAPENLVADLQPVPGTDLAEDGGYSSVWYFYCLKRFKNAQGKASGHRQRAITGGETCWHSEAGPKPVKGLDGATHCNLSYGRKEGSGRSFNRMGWCMTEYDDKNGGGGDHVLCKVHRSSSSLAKGKSKLTTTQRSSGCKRKATAAEHPQAPPTKMSLSASVDHQVPPSLLSGYQTTECSDHQVEHYQQKAMFPMDQQQFQDNTMDELLNVSGFLDCEFTMDELFNSATSVDQVEHHQVQPPLLTCHQMMTMPESLFLTEEAQLQQITFFPAEGQQLEQITMIPAEEQQLEQDIVFPAEEQEDIFITSEEQQQLQDMLSPAEEQQLQQQNILFPSEEQQFQQDIFFPAEAQQQLEENTMIPAEEDQLQQHNTFFPAEQQQQQSILFPAEGLQPIEPNTLHTMEELLRDLVPTMDELSSGCCDTPKAMAPPDAAFFEGLAAF